MFYVTESVRELPHNRARMISLFEVYNLKTDSMVESGSREEVERFLRMNQPDHPFLSIVEAPEDVRHSL